MNSDNKYHVYIDGKLNHLAKDQVDAVWNLGAKFGGIEYNKLYQSNRIQFGENKVEVFTS